MSQNKNKDRHPNGRGGLNGFVNRRVSFQSFVQCRTAKRHNAGAFFQYYSSGRNGFDRKFFSRARHFNNVANVDVINWIHLATNYQIICCCGVIHKKIIFWFLPPNPPVCFSGGRWCFNSLKFAKQYLFENFVGCIFQFFAFDVLLFFNHAK